MSLVVANQVNAVALSPLKVLLYALYDALQSSCCIW